MSTVKDLEAKSLRILCIDGGGIKGYTALLVLRRILRTLSTDTGGSTILKPCDLFDLIAGTSTGGIIAVMLGRLHMTVDECIEVYERLGKAVFGKPVGGQLGRIVRGITSSPFYDIEDLQESIRLVMKARNVGPDEPFLEQEPKCKVMLCVTRIETGKADVLRNYKSTHPTAENYSCTVWEAASATAAAPIYFKSVKFAYSGERWCDGALRRNNPINEALAELSREPEWQGRDIGCVLSLGTGLARRRSVSSNLASFMKGAMKMLTDAEDIAQVFSSSALGRQLAHTGRYYRFNVPQGMEDMQLDEWKATERMKAITTEYLSHADNGDLVLSCSKSLLYPDENLQRALPPKPSLTPHLPCTHFVRRPLYQDKLQAFFSPRMTRTQVFALWGIGGAGKTQIALNFAQSMKDRLSVYWIRADSLANFIADYSRILPLIQPGESTEPTDTISVLETTREKLEQSAGDWLLILDNADHLEDFIGSSSGHGDSLSISKYVPRRGRILITTRDRRFQGLIAAASDGLCVEPMTTGEATDLLLKSVPAHLVQPNSANTLMAGDLVEELGCLPLAIAQAAANIVDQQMSFAEYVGLFRLEKGRRADLMASPAFDFANKDTRNGISSVAITWKISVDALQRQSPLSVVFLRYLACFHWKEAPQLLLRHVPEFQDLDDASFLYLTKRAVALSLVDQTLDSNPKLSTYSVHPVLHEIMAADLPIDEKHRMLGHLIPVMFRVFPTAPTPKAEGWPLAVILAPHLARQLELCQEAKYSSQLVAVLMFSLSRVRSVAGMHTTAADLADAGLSVACETIGPDEELIAYFRQNAIEMLNDAGRYDRSEKECSLALEMLELQGANSVTDAKAYNQKKVRLLGLLSVALRGQDEYGRLEEIHQEQLRCHEQAAEWTADDVLHRHNLAHGLLYNGKLAEARELNEQLIKYAETPGGMAIVGKKLYLIMLNLKIRIMRNGKDVWQHYDGIVDLYDRIFCENLADFGIHDRETWIALNNRVGSLNEAFRMDEVGDVLQSVLPRAIAAKAKADGRVVVPMGEIYRVATNYLAYLSRRSNSDDSHPHSLDEFRQLLERWVYVSGLEDAMKANAANTGTSYMHLESLNTQAVHLQEHGQCEEAEKIHRHVIAQLAQNGLPSSGLSQLSHYNLMMSLARRGRDSEALAYREEHRSLIAPMEAIFRTLGERLAERDQMRRTYDEAEERIAKGTLRRSDEWWRRNSVVVRRWGARVGRDVVPPE